MPPTSSPVANSPEIGAPSESITQALVSIFNYPGGTGLMNGSVFGKIAGTTAGERAKQLP